MEKQGRLNKRNHEVYEIVVNEQEAAVVREIFDLYVTKGMGSHRICTYLTKKGIFNRKGTNFTNGTIRNMLKNRAYLGIIKNGETESEIFKHLQIIDPCIFEAAQKLLEQRSLSNEERRVPLNTKSRSLLSGNVFCGHCGARLIVTTSGKYYHRKDGDVTVTHRIRYVCYNRTRHKHLCNGQTGYTVSKLDDIIDQVVHKLFEQLNGIPKEQIVARKFAKQIDEYQTKLSHARAILQSHRAEMKEYEAEVLKIIRGESNLSSELLNKLYEESKAKVNSAAETVRELEEKIKNSEKLRDELFRQYDTITRWAELYDTCDIETKKMIISRLMNTIRVKRGYEIEIDLAFSDYL